MEETYDGDKMDEFMLPGFRFHPTDEELVGFYLKRKIQQRPPSIELIKQLDVYKYDPWNLPKLATSGEKEWYFYCPRDRKYRNSARPNRVTSAGVWKATGTDRPIYSSEGTSKCIGLKKSLVFYKGRAARGIKTDWMMHEFRLPSLTDHHTEPPKKFISKSIPAANDSWAICRIFKKTNSAAQRALSHSFVSPLPETTTSIQHNFNHDHDTQQPSTTTSTAFSPLDYFPSYKPNINPLAAGKPSQLTMSCGDLTSFMFVPHELTFTSLPPAKCTVHVSSILSSSMLGDYNYGNYNEVSERTDFGGLLSQEHFSQMSLLHDQMQGNISNYNALVKNPNVDDDQRETIRSFGFPLISSLPISVGVLKQNLLWDSSSCLSIDQSFSTNIT